MELVWKSRGRVRVLSPVGGVSFLLWRESSRSAGHRVLLGLRPSEAFCFGWLSELRLLFCFGGNLSRLFGSSCKWRLRPLLALLLDSWSFSFSILFPGLVRRIGLFLELDPRKNDASTGWIGASSHQHVLRSVGGFAGARKDRGDWIQLALAGARVRTS